MKKLAAFLVAVLSAAASTRAQSLVNGDFEDGLHGWTVDGAVTVDETLDNDFAIFREDPQAKKSRIYQVFNIPPLAQTASFRYLLLWSEETTPSASATNPDATGGPRYRTDLTTQGGTVAGFPNDSFSAFLLDPVTLTRLLPPLGEPPMDFDDFFFADNTGLIDSNGQYVSISEPDSDGIRTVTLDISSLPSGLSVRLEFGLAGGPDGLATIAILDDIVIEGGTTCGDCPYDVNRNTAVDTGDFAFFLSCFATFVDPENPCSCFDVNRNGAIDTGDFAGFLGCFARFCPCP